MFHGILIDKEFEGKDFINSFKVINKKQAGDWGIFGIEVEDSKVEEAVKSIQENLKSDQPWYAHLYNNEVLVVIFKEKVFRVTSDKSTWTEVLEYGRQLNIPEEQLDFQPNKFEQENKYFN